MTHVRGEVPGRRELYFTPTCEQLRYALKLCIFKKHSKFLKIVANADSNTLSK